MTNDITVRVVFSDGSDMVWDRRQIIDFSSTIQTKSDAASIYYGVLPSSGTIEIVDIDKKITNAVQQGLIGNNYLKLEIMNNGKVVRTHLTKECSYNPDTNVLTLTLTDILDTWDKINVPARRFSGERTVLELVEELITYSIETIYINVLATSVNGTYNDDSIYIELGRVVVPNPYWDAGTLRQQFDKICQLMQLQLTVNADGHPIFVYSRPVVVDMSKILYIPYSNQYSALQYDLITKNKYDIANITCKNIEYSLSAVDRQIDSKDIYKMTISNLMNLSAYVTLEAYNAGHKTGYVVGTQFVFEHINDEDNKIFLIYTETPNGTGCLWLETTIPVPNDFDFNNTVINMVVGRKKYAFRILPSRMPDPAHNNLVAEDYLQTIESINLTKNDTEVTITDECINKFSYNTNESELSIKALIFINDSDNVMDTPYGTFNIVSKLVIGIYASGAIVHDDVTVVYGDGTNTYSYGPNELMQSDAYNQIEEWNQIQKSAERIVLDYIKGVYSGSLSIMLDQYKNIYGDILPTTFTKNIYDVGTIIEVQGLPYRWEITSNTLRKTACPFIDLQLMQVINKNEYKIYIKTDKNVQLKIDRISSTDSNAPVSSAITPNAGILKDGDYIYANDIITLDASCDSERKLSVTLNGNELVQGETTSIHLDKIPPDIEVGIDSDIYIIAESYTNIEKDTLDDIITYANNGTAHTRYNVGDQKEFLLNNNEMVTAVILDFQRDNISDSSTKSEITLGLVGCVNTLEALQDYEAIMQKYYDLLPDNLKAAIKTVDKVTGPRNETTQSKCFLLSTYEIFNVDQGRYTTDVFTEGTQYKYYKNLIGNSPSSKNLIKYRNGQATTYWLRSEFGSGQNNVIDNFLGVLAAKALPVELGISFCFCL